MSRKYLKKWSKDIISKIEATDISSHPWSDIKITIKELLHNNVFRLLFWIGRGQLMQPLPDNKPNSPIIIIRYCVLIYYIMMICELKL